MLPIYRNYYDILAKLCINNTYINNKMLEVNLLKATLLYTDS